MRSARQGGRVDPMGRQLIPELAPMQPYVITSYFWQFVDHWQTLFTGGFALLAGSSPIWQDYSKLTLQHEHPTLRSL